MKCTSDISPEKLNDIEVRRLSWPLQNLHFFVLLLCPVNGWFGLVFWIIVTLEGPSASCAQFSDWWVQIAINFVHFSHRLCGLPSKYSIYGFDHKFHFWSHHFKWLTFDLLLTKWHTVWWPWLSNGFFLFLCKCLLIVDLESVMPLSCC